MYAVVMAGGGGTRLWPLSLPARPKPFLPRPGHESLIQRTVARRDARRPVRSGRLSSQAERRTQLGHPVGLLPREVAVTAEVAVGGGLAVDRPAQVEVAQDGGGDGEGGGQQGGSERRPRREGEPQRQPRAATGSGASTPVSARSSSALSVRSQGRSRSSRPKWP